MTQVEVIQALQDAGWRWEYFGGAKCLPVLTNAPPDQRLCVKCGTWWPESFYTLNKEGCKWCRSGRYN